MAEIKFWKMHGIGNDYIVIDNRNEFLEEKQLADMVKKLCRRKYSVGADGTLIVYDSLVADVKMRVLNADGSEAEMCGNGIRCFSKYCYEQNITNRKNILVETKAGIRECFMDTKKGKVQNIRVNMGKPYLSRKDVPMSGKGKCLNEKIQIGKHVYEATCLSMGNPHCVLFVDDLNTYPIHEVGPRIENHRLFPNRTNVDFVEIVNRKELRLRVWERGCGETLACGTGACASVVAGNLLNIINSKCTVHLLGGDLIVDYNGVVMMEGEAEKVFEGII
jgi:diaminopimelate epimerase